MAAIIPVLPFLLIVGFLLRIPHDPVIEITVDDELLRIRLGFWDKLYCLHGDFEIPVGHVEGVAVAPLRLVPQEGMRLPGTGLPGVIRAGSYSTGATRDFWDVRKAEQVLVIQLRPGAEYRRLVLQLPDPKATALAVRPVVGAYAGTFR